MGRGNGFGDTGSRVWSSPSYGGPGPRLAILGRPLPPLLRLRPRRHRHRSCHHRLYSPLAVPTTPELLKSDFVCSLNWTFQCWSLSSPNRCIVSGQEWSSDGAWFSPGMWFEDILLGIQFMNWCDRSSRTCFEWRLSACPIFCFHEFLLSGTLFSFDFVLGVWISVQIALNPWRILSEWLTCMAIWSSFGDRAQCRVWIYFALCIFWIL